MRRQHIITLEQILTQKFPSPRIRGERNEEPITDVGSFRPNSRSTNGEARRRGTGANRGAVPRFTLPVTEGVLMELPKKKAEESARERKRETHTSISYFYATFGGTQTRSIYTPACPSDRPLLTNPSPTARSHPSRSHANPVAPLHQPLRNSASASTAWHHSYRGPR